MKKVRYASVSNQNYGSLTNHKVYDVIRFIPYDVNSRIVDRVEIINNYGKPQICDFSVYGIDFFTDVTAEYRDEVINGILK